MDLNRNWGTDYGGLHSTSRNPCEGIYIGTGAFSEPETQVVRDFVERTPGILAHLDIHAYSQVLLGAWAYTDDNSPNDQESSIVGLDIADAISSVNDKKYTFGKGGELLYLASGTMSDWITSQGILSFTLELRPSLTDGDGFLLPEDEILPTCLETAAGSEVLLNYANDPIAYISTKSGRISTEAIVGIATGGVVVLVLAAVLAIYLARRRARKSIGENAAA